MNGTRWLQIATTLGGLNYYPVFLKFTEQDILNDPGKVSMEVAQALALEQYEKYEQGRRQIEAEKGEEEFEGMVKRIEGITKLTK